MYFMGKYNHTIDPKGRLSIPSKFREQLGDEFVLSRGMDDCLFLYPIEEWEKFADKISDLDLLVEENRDFARYFLSEAQYVTVDKQGRILMPSDLREEAGLDKDVVISGMGKRIEIWSLDSWNKNREKVNIGQTAKSMTGMGIKIGK